MPEHSHPSRKKPNPRGPLPTALTPDSNPWQPPIYFLRVFAYLLDISCKGNHTVYVLCVWLLSFSMVSRIICVIQIQVFYFFSWCRGSHYWLTDFSFLGLCPCFQVRDSYPRSSIHIRPVGSLLWKMKKNSFTTIFRFFFCMLKWWASKCEILGYENINNVSMPPPS